MHSGPSPEEVQRVVDALMPMILAIASILSIISLAMTILLLVIFCKLFQKMGHHWALGFLVLLPLAWIAILIYMAFSRWPVLEELDRLRSAAGGGAPPAWMPAAPKPPASAPTP
ncbi:MAG: hypothetical protein JXL80_02640 [Planctomycetes bacterium]|nr:hypothetical protein [Planctomycetota bacterium]